MHTCMMAERKRYLKDKKRNVMNWINGFDAGNKKEKYSLTCRIGTFTILEIKIESNKFRFMIFNLGFEI
jgi:hypothetical protein